ncbi:MAG: hypothetical protein H0W16_11485 [Actinobacteria bacterium]|nr:hypothetical protein [Actinomycetota bacterium]
MDSARARELLGRERQRIEHALAERREPGGASDLSSRDEPLGDEAADLQARELAEGMVEQLEVELEALERAEARLEAGTYGTSVESGESIPDDRLGAYPLAERTIEEEERFERR